MSTPLTATSDAMDEVIARARTLRLAAELEARGVDLEASRLPSGDAGSALLCWRNADALLAAESFKWASEKAFRGLTFLLGFGAIRGLR
jgi:hypothetical protein